MLIYIIEDDPDWQSFYKKLLTPNYSTSNVLNSREKTPAGGFFPGEESREKLSNLELRVFSDGVSAIQAIDENLPSAIILDMLLTGPSAPSLLSELQSYEDTSRIPIALVTGIDIKTNLSSYGVSAIFDKATMNPKDLLQWISKLQA